MIALASAQLPAPPAELLRTIEMLIDETGYEFRRADLDYLRQGRNPIVELIA